MKNQATPITGRQCSMARHILGWSLDDLAEKSGVGRATIARFENGDVLKDATTERIQSAFDLHRVRFVTEGAWAGVVSRMTAA